MKQTITAMLISAGLLASAPLLAQSVNVEITNLTNGTYFTPLLVAVHRSDDHLFEVGSEASANLQAMAEGGDISGLEHDVAAAGGIALADPAGGLLAPGESAMTGLNQVGSPSFRLSIVAMLLPSNDGFVGLDGLRIPADSGTYTYYLNGYDAGTEANDEIINGGGAPGVPGIPADPGGSGGMNASGAAGPDHNTRVHVHRGVLGDTDPLGGISDLDRRVHRWQNPVARVVLHVGLSGAF